MLGIFLSLLLFLWGIPRKYDPCVLKWCGCPSSEAAEKALGLGQPFRDSC
jgi:hypothetical protein